MKSTYFNVTSIIALVIGVITFSGCLNSNGNKISSQVRFGMQVDDFDSTLVSGNNDSLFIDRMRFVYGDGSVVIDQDTNSVVPTPTDWLQFGLNQNSGNPIAMFSASSGTFSNFVLSVQKAPTNNSNIDADFTDSTTQYSMIIEGKYNGSDFSYKMDRSFKASLEITPPVQVPQYNAAYTFLIHTSPRLWFTNHQGGFYNPKTADDTTNINGNIENSFSIETINNSGSL